MYLIPVLLLSVLLFYVTIEKNMKGLLYFMKRYDFTITSDRGFHAQPVAALASIACKSASCVTLEYDGGEIDVSNAIRLMSACISYNDKVSLIVSGSDEDETMEKLKEIVTSQLL